MTYNPMQSVTEFHDKFHRDGKGRHERPISVSDLDRRLRLITEEFMEVDEAFLSYSAAMEFSSSTKDIEYNRSQVAKELADLLYVIYGTAEELNIPMEEVFQEVHQSNMSKLWPDGTVHYNDFGKVIKPPTYSPPDIEKILYGE